MNRLSKNSRDQINQISGDKGPRATAGEYQLETIHEIHDEVADPDFRSDGRSPIYQGSYGVLTPKARNSIDVQSRSSKQDNPRVSKYSEISDLPFKPSITEGNLSSKKKKQSKALLRGNNEKEMMYSLSNLPQQSISQAQKSSPTDHKVLFDESLRCRNRVIQLIKEVNPLQVDTQLEATI